MSRLSFRPRPLDIHKKLPIVKSIKDFEDDDTPTSTRTQMLRLVAEADNDTQVLLQVYFFFICLFFFFFFSLSFFQVEILFLKYLQVHQAASKKTVSEIPTPEYVIVDTYERDYSPTFNQPASYLRARGGLYSIKYQTFNFQLYNLHSPLIYIHVNNKIIIFPARAELGDFVEYDLDNEDEDWLQEFNKERLILPAEKYNSFYASCSSLSYSLTSNFFFYFFYWADLRLLYLSQRCWIIRLVKEQEL